jgi:CelD/BcsL family acetyltransferase involved in cellulose biosynthesis
VKPQIRMGELLKAADLVGWDFHHVPQDQSALVSGGRDAKRSWTIDLRGGYEAYVAGKGREGSSLFDKLRYSERRMAREVGPVVFTLDDDSEAASRALFSWKSQQYRNAGHPDQFAVPHNRALIERLGEIRKPGFAGVLSTLRAGSEIVAVHFGMRTNRRLHYWFPAYSRAMSVYSPGLILLQRLCAAASAEGLSTIDLGCGDDSYKLRFATGSIPVIEGSFNARTALGIARTFRQSGWSALRQSELAQPALRARDKLRAFSYAFRSPGSPAPPLPAPDLMRTPR